MSGSDCAESGRLRDSRKFSPIEGLKDSLRTPTLDGQTSWTFSRHAMGGASHCLSCNDCFRPRYWTSKQCFSGGLSGHISNSGKLRREVTAESWFFSFLRVILAKTAPTQPRVEGKVEIRPTVGISAPVSVSLVTICLQRRETIHPYADSVTKKHLAAPRKELTDIVGKEMLLFRSPAGKEYENVFAMDLPFVLFIPFGRGGEETARKVPPASLQLASRTAETYYEMLVTVQQGQTEQKKYAFPVPISRYDTLSTFGMYNRPNTTERITDHLVTLGTSLPRWSYGPLDPVSVYIHLQPNPDWLSKAKRVTIQKITISIEEEITYNHEGDEPQRKTKTIAKQTQTVGVKMPEAGYFTNLGLVFPAKDSRDSDGILPRGKQAFPMYSVSGFTTTGSLYKIEYFLAVKVCQH